MVDFILLVHDSHFCYFFLGDINMPSSETSLSFWEDSFTRAINISLNASGLSRCRQNGWHECAKVIRVCGTCSARYCDTRSFPVSAQVRRRLEKLRHLASVRLTCMQVYAPTTSHSDEETDYFYNTIDNILEKQTHYTIIVMGDFNVKVGGQTNTLEMATCCFGLGQINERGDTLEWATTKNFKVMNT